MTSVCPPRLSLPYGTLTACPQPSNGEQTITSARAGRQWVLAEAAAAACSDYMVEVEAFDTVGKRAATRRYKPLKREGLERGTTTLPITT